MNTNTTTKRSPLSDKHKDALAEGRTHASTVNKYLQALATVKPKRGRKRTIERVKEELATVEQELPEAAAAQRILLIQKRMDLNEELETMQTTSFDITPFEDAFVKVAPVYSAKKKISPAAWKEYGIPNDVLKRAGIIRGRSTNGNGNGNGHKNVKK